MAENIVDTLEAMFTRDRFQTDPVRKSDRIGLLFTRNHFRTGPERIQTNPKLDLLFYGSNFGSVEDRFRKRPV